VALIIGTWVWGSKYPKSYIEKLAAGVARHLKQPYAFSVFRPLEEDEHLTRIPGCFARLRMFDPAWQKLHGIRPGDRLVCMDLDMVVTGSLDELFDRPANFTILQGVNAANPCPMNGSLWMLRAGYRPDVWSDFSIEAASKVPHFTFPDDQAWFAYKMPDAPDAGAWGPREGVYGFHKPGWPRGDGLPSGARCVAFFGHRDPSQFTHLEWVRENWC
jgi:hypothetical protein